MENTQAIGSHSFLGLTIFICIHKKIKIELEQRQTLLSETFFFFLEKQNKVDIGRIDL